MGDAALRANTLRARQEAFGTVCFKRDKKGKFSVLAIPVGTVQLEFGVQWQQARAGHEKLPLVSALWGHRQAKPGERAGIPGGFAVGRAALSSRARPPSPGESYAESYSKPSSSVALMLLDARKSYEKLSDRRAGCGIGAAAEGTQEHSACNGHFESTC